MGHGNDSSRKDTKGRVISMVNSMKLFMTPMVIAMALIVVMLTNTGCSTIQSIIGLNDARGENPTERSVPYNPGKTVDHPETIDLVNPVVSNGTRTITCSLCHGDGICSHCNGEAFRNGRRCNSCNGTGRCDHCSGEGSFNVLEIDGKDYTVCGFCHGTGTCDYCDGLGEESYTFTTLGTSTVKCWLCNGSGKCRGCNGTGYEEVKGF